MFDQPKPFDEARRFLMDFIRQLDSKGWHPRGSIDIPRSPVDLDTRTPWTIIAQLDDMNGNSTEITMADHGLIPKQESWIAVPLGRSDHPSHDYLVQVSVSGPSLRDTRNAIYPRRLFINGNKNAALPLRVWVEGPDWSPAAHGISKIPEAEREGDISFWSMPK